MNNAGGQTYATQTAPSPAEGVNRDTPYFSRSTSEAQGYHAAQSRDARAGEGISGEKAGETTFRRSASESQAVVQAEKVKDERHGVVWRLKNAFLKSENAIGTWMTLGFIKGWTDKTMGAWGRSSPFNKLTEAGTPLGNLKQRIPPLPGASKFSDLTFGKGFDKSKLVQSTGSQTNSIFKKSLAVGVTGALIQNLVFFMTARGGEIPDGDTMGQRVMNSLKNPDKHSVHFSNATMSAFIGLIGLSRVGIGLQGLKDNRPDETKKNAMMLVSGLSAMLSAPLIFIGIFKIKKDGGKTQGTADPEAAAAKQKQMMERDEQAFSKDGAGKKSGKSEGGGLVASLKPAHLKEMWQYAVKNDRMGLIGRALAITMELGFMVDGRMQIKQGLRSPEGKVDASAYNTVKGGLIGLVLTCMQTHFVYDRLLTDSKKEQTAAR